jgi:hypothetical protein
LEVPPWAADIFHVATGDAWPAADEDEIYRLAQLWLSAGAQLLEFAPEVTRAARYMASSGALAGDGQRALATAVAAVTGDGDLTLDKLAAGFEEMGLYLRRVAVQTQYMKIVVIEELIILAAQIAWLIAMLPWTFGASVAGIGPLQVFGRQFALAMMSELATAIGAGVVLQVGLDAIAQLAQVAEGWRTGLDEDLFWSAVITGGFGGVLGPVVRGLGHHPAKALGRALGKAVGAGAGRETAQWGIGVLGGAAHEYLTDGTAGLVQGQGWRPDTFSTTAGALDEGSTSAAGLGRRKRGAPPWPDLPQPPAMEPLRAWDGRADGAWETASDASLPGTEPEDAGSDTGSDTDTDTSWTTAAETWPDHPEARPDTAAGSGSGVLTPPQAAAFWGLTAGTGSGDRHLTGRVPLTEVFAAGSLGYGQIVAVRLDPTELDPTELDPRSPGPVSPARDPLQVSAAVARAVQAAGGLAVDVGPVVDEVGRLMPRWSAVDAPIPTEARRLWQGVEVRAEARAAAGTHSGTAARIVELRLAARGGGGPDVLPGRLTELPERPEPGRSEALLFVGSTKNEVRRGINDTGTTNALAAAGLGVVSTPVTVTARGQGFLGLVAGADSSRQTSIAPGDVAAPKGSGAWVSYDLPAELRVSVRPDGALPGIASQVPAARSADDDRGEARNDAAVPVRLRIRVPIEMTRTADTSVRPEPVPVAAGEATGRDLFTAVTMAPEAVSLGDLHRQVRRAVAAEAGHPWSEHPASPATWAVDAVTTESTFLRYFRQLGSGVHSPRFALSAPGQTDWTRLRDGPVLPGVRASLVGADRWLVRGTPSGQLRVWAQVTGVEILDPVDGGSLVAESKQRQGMLDLETVAGSTAAGAGGVAEARLGLGPDGPAAGAGGGLLGMLDAGRSATSTLGVITYHKSKISLGGPMRRARLVVQWAADLARSDVEGRTAQGDGSSRWPVVTTGQVVVRLAEADLQRLVTAASGDVRHLPVPRAKPSGATGLALHSEPAAVPADALPPPPLRAGQGLGGGQIDELGGAWRAPDEWERAARGLVADLLAEHGSSEGPVPGQFWLALRQGLEIQLSPGALRAQQAALVQSGVRVQPMVQVLAPGPFAHATTPELPQLVVDGSLRARVVPGSARHVGSRPSVGLTYGSEQWQVDLLTREVSRSAAGRATASLTLAGAVAGGVTSASGTAALRHTEALTQSVATTSGVWVASDPHLSWSGQAELFHADVEYELSVTARLSGSDEHRTTVTWPGHLRVVTPTELVPPASGQSAPTAPGPAAAAPWTPVRYGRTERVLELRTGPLVDVVADVLREAGAGHPGLTAAETVGDLHMVLDPESLRIRLRLLLQHGGLTIPFPSPADRRVAGVLRITPEFVVGPEGPIALGRPDGVPARLAEEHDLWLQNETSVVRSRPRTGRLTLTPMLGAQLPQDASFSLGGQAMAEQATNRQTTRMTYLLDEAGERVTWEPQPLRVESRGVRWHVSYRPTARGTATTRPAARVFVVEDGATVVIPDAGHPLHRLAPAPKTGAGEALAAQWSTGTSVDARVLPGNGIVLPLAAFAEHAAPVHAAPVHAAPVLDEPVLDEVLALLRAHGPRFLVPLPQSAALVASLPDGAERPRRYVRLDPVVRDGLSTQFLPSLLPYALAGGVAVPLRPYRDGSLIVSGFLHLRAAVTGRPRPAGRIEPGDAQLQRHYLRTDAYAARVTASTDTMASLTGQAFQAVVPTPVGHLSAGWVHQPRITAGVAASHEVLPSTEVWSQASVLAPHLVFEAEAVVTVALLRDRVRSPWNTLLGAPLRAARWLGAWWRSAAGRPAVPLPATSGAGPSRRVATRLRFAVPEPLVRHPPRPPRVSRLPAAAAQHLRAAERLRPSPDALGHGAFLSWSIRPEGVRDLVDTIIDGLVEDAGPAATALARGGHVSQAVRYALSAVGFGARFNELLAGDTHSVPLGSLSGLVSDVGTHLELEVSLIGARALTWATVSRNRSPTSLRGFGEYVGHSRSRGSFDVLNVSGTVAGAALTGTLVAARAGLTGHRWRGKNEMADVQSHSQTGPMLFASVDLLAHATLTTTAESALTLRAPAREPHGGRRSRVDVRADDTAVVMITWDEARRLGIWHPDGEATTGGWHLPPARPPSRTPHVGPAHAATGPQPSGTGGSDEEPAVTDPLAHAAHGLPSFADWTLLSGHVGGRDRLLLYGRPVDPAELVAILGRHALPGDRPGVVLVASGGLDAGRTLARAAGRPVVATSGQVAPGPDGIRAAATRTGGGWVLLLPGADHPIPLADDLGTALTMPPARRAAAATGTHRTEPPGAAAAAPAVDLGETSRRPADAIWWPRRRTPRT